MFLQIFLKLEMLDYTVSIYIVKNANDRDVYAIRSGT
jgi:hypothetical protein